MTHLLTLDGMDFSREKKSYMLDFANAVNQCFILNGILLSDGLLWGKGSFSLETKFKIFHLSSTIIGT